MPIKYTISGIYSTLEEADGQLMLDKPQLLLTDIRLGKRKNSFSMIEKTTKLLPDTKIVIYTSYPCIWLYIKLYRIRVTSFAIIDKSEIPDWNNVFDEIAMGGKYMSEKISHLNQKVISSTEIAQIINLSERVWEMLLLFAKGKSDDEISEE